MEQVEYLKDYTKQGQLIEIKTSNKLSFNFRFLDEDGEEWFIGKLLNNRYRRIKKESITSLKINDI